MLTQREIAKQEKATFHEQQNAQIARIEMEKAEGTADMQGQLRQSQVSVEINAQPGRRPRGRGPGRGGVRRDHRSGRGGPASGHRPGRGGGRPRRSVSPRPPASRRRSRRSAARPPRWWRWPTPSSEGGIKVVPDVLVTGGGGATEGLAASLIELVRGRTSTS